MRLITKTMVDELNKVFASAGNISAYHGRPEPKKDRIAVGVFVSTPRYESRKKADGTYPTGTMLNAFLTLDIASTDINAIDLVKETTLGIEDTTNLTFADDIEQLTIRNIEYQTEQPGYDDDELYHVAQTFLVQYVQEPIPHN